MGVVEPDDSFVSIVQLVLKTKDSQRVNREASGWREAQVGGGDESARYIPGAADEETARLLGPRCLARLGKLSDKKSPVLSVGSP